ncbi:MAG: zinc ribbon domain-containing protein, partial [Lachnospiraceae bacterium]|nr:zinc ribbon domain-containing protein [Lachnospiraceae bacterium]
MFCPNCGSAVTEDSCFCGECGWRLQETGKDEEAVQGTGERKDTGEAEETGNRRGIEKPGGTGNRKEAEKPGGTGNWRG